MNNKGFSLIELLATIVVLSIVVGITLVGLNFNTKKAREKAEEVFVHTIEDAISMYLDTDAKSLNFGTPCKNELNKSTSSTAITVYYADVTLADIINTDYTPLLASDLVNPNNEDVSCNTSASVRIYRDEDYVYYYKMAKSESNFGCLTLDLEGYITNLPSGFSCK